MMIVTTATAPEIQKALGIKGSLKYAAIDGDEVAMTVAVSKGEFLKGLKVGAGELQAIETEVAENGVITAIKVTAVGEVAAPAKRGRKPKAQ